MTEEQTEYVYSRIKENKPVQPMFIHNVNMLIEKREAMMQNGKQDTEEPQVRASPSSLKGNDENKPQKLEQPFFSLFENRPPPSPHPEQEPSQAYVEQEEELEDEAYEEPNPYATIFLEPSQCPYREYKENPFENWSILSETVEYPAQTKFHRHNYINNVNSRRMRKYHQAYVEQDPVDLEEQFNNHSIYDTEYLDCFEGIQCSLNETLTHDDKREISTTYLGKTRSVRDTDFFEASPHFNVKPNSTVDFLLPDGNKGSLLLDTGATQSYMSREFYERNQWLHHLPKYNTRAKSITVGNGEKVPILFAIPLQIHIQGHLFEIFTLISQIQPSMDIILGIKNMVEIEGTYELSKLRFKFRNRSIPIYPKEDTTIQPGKTKELEVEIPFAEELTGEAITKWRKGDQVDTVKLRITRNKAVVTIKKSVPTPSSTYGRNQ